MPHFLAEDDPRYPTTIGRSGLGPFDRLRSPFRDFFVNITERITGLSLPRTSTAADYARAAPEGFLYMGEPGQPGSGYFQPRPIYEGPPYPGSPTLNPTSQQYPVSQGGATPAGAPETGGLGLTPEQEEWLDRILESQENNRLFNLEQREIAINRLTGPGGFSEQVEKALPLNPFSDALRQALLDSINDQTTKTGQYAFGEAATNLASRGLSSSGTTAQTAAGGIQSDILGRRIGAETSTKEAQLSFNQASNLARETLLKEIMGGAANIQAGNILDPEAYANTLTGARGEQLAGQNMQKFLDYIKTLDPTMAQQIVSLIPAFASTFLSSSDRAQFGGFAFDQLFGGFR